MAATEVAEPLNFKTWVLKVSSIHCEGCKKKIKKLLHKVQGVYKVDIDAKDQMVTIIGDVDADTLIKKLKKSSKHAELLMPMSQKGSTESGENKKKEKQKLQNGRPKSSSEGAGHGCDNQEKKPGAEVEVVLPEDAKTGEIGCREPPTAPCEHKNNEGDGGGAGGVHDGAKNDPTEGNNLSPPVTEVSNCAENQNHGGGNTSSSHGHVGKRKEMEGQNGNIVEAVAELQLPPYGPPSPAQNAGPPRMLYPTNRNLPNQHMNNIWAPPTLHINPPHQNMHHFHHPPPHYHNYHPHPPPEYSVRYNTTPLSSSYTASYQAPMYFAQSPAYTPSYPGPANEPSPSDWRSYDRISTRQPSDSFEMFTEENPNTCSIM